MKNFYEAEYITDIKKVMGHKQQFVIKDILQFQARFNLLLCGELILKKEKRDWTFLFVFYDSSFVRYFLTYGEILSVIPPLFGNKKRALKKYIESSEHVQYQFLSYGYIENKEKTL